MTIDEQITDCRLCADRFAATATGHLPRPVAWFRSGTPIVIAGQALGARVHASGRPFTDHSGDRLRDWMGIGDDVFFDRSLISILPMAFCFPGYNAKGSDLPPPAICARTWRQGAMDHIGPASLLLLVGSYAQKWHLSDTASVTDRVARWRDHAPAVFPLPHPSWRNTGWIKKNPWFEAELLPALRGRVCQVIANQPAAD